MSHGPGTCTDPGTRLLRAEAEVALDVVGGTVFASSLIHPLDIDNAADVAVGSKSYNWAMRHSKEQQPCDASGV
jgi:hypothetical protein